MCGKHICNMKFIWVTSISDKWRYVRSFQILTNKYERMNLDIFYSHQKFVKLSTAISFWFFLKKNQHCQYFQLYRITAVPSRLQGFSTAVCRKTFFERNLHALYINFKQFVIIAYFSQFRRHTFGLKEDQHSKDWWCCWCEL